MTNAFPGASTKCPHFTSVTCIPMCNNCKIVLCVIIIIYEVIIAIIVRKDYICHAYSCVHRSGLKLSGSGNTAGSRLAR